VLRMLQFFCIDMRKDDYEFILCTVLACCCQGITRCKDQGKVSMVGSSLSLVQWEITNKSFPGWVGVSLCPCQVLFPQNNMFAPHGYYGTGCILLTNDTCSSLWWLPQTLSMLILCINFQTINRVICEVTLSLGLLAPSPSPLSVVSAK
jgi:hypothetical protein